MKILNQSSLRILEIELLLIKNHILNDDWFLKISLLTSYKWDVYVLVLTYLIENIATAKGISSNSDFVSIENFHCVPRHDSKITKYYFCPTSNYSTVTFFE